MKSNKYFSDKQESTIAGYLGWSQITGSGSRPFAPGDLKEYQWLGECKTHTTERANIVFMKCHWFKIREEARAKCRYPVLFVDNGTQRKENTWVMTYIRLFSPETLNIIDGLKNTSTKGNSLTFNMEDADTLYRQNTKEGKFGVFKINWDTELAVMPLSTFRDFVEENF